MAAAIAGGLGIPIATWPPKNYSEAKAEILIQIRAIDNASSAFKQVGIVAGGQIRAGSAVYIADDGMAYTMKG